MEHKWEKKKRKLTTDFWLFGKINKTTFWTGYYFEQNWEVPEISEKHKLS